jgi:hypothetical protein
MEDELRYIGDISTEEDKLPLFYNLKEIYSFIQNWLYMRHE